MYPNVKYTKDITAEAEGLVTVSVDCQAQAL